MSSSSTGVHSFLDARFLYSSIGLALERMRSIEPEEEEESLSYPSYVALFLEEVEG